MSRKFWLFAALATASVAAAGGWFLWEDTPEPEPEAPAEDSGMSEERTEELMRTIGYVQQ